MQSINNLIGSQIAIICWANADILLAVLLARRRQMTLAGVILLIGPTYLPTVGSMLVQRP